MRDTTRSYTHQLPRLTLADLRTMREMFASGSVALRKVTRNATLTITADSNGYNAEIDGKIIPLKVRVTEAGYGVRSWYCCPHCDSRRASLFIGASDIACRECWGIHYANQSESQLDRMRRRMWKMRAELWPDYKPAMSLFNHPYDFPKPKGMRWETFTEKQTKLVRCESAYWMAFRPVVERITGVIERKAGKAARAIGLEL